MFKIIKQKKIYQKLYRRYGHSIDALHWRSKKTQHARFKALCEIQPKRGSLILDIGCGFGDFFGYLQRHLYFTKDVGCEITPEFAAIAKQDYPKATIYQGDYLDIPNIEPDYIFASGIFAFGNRRFFRKVARKALLECQKGFAFNICTDESFDHIDPVEVLEFLSQLTPNIEVIEGYLDNDITFLAHPQIVLPSRSQSRFFSSHARRRALLTS
ncbi:MAG: hypothetical protein SP1CHLAM54_05280 [Chlamydiia bacterium]|nr:hypothetical protein [Chlamydiia bacterium]MCH9615440.1 hypothetical protein [Chlamydiia bacterium]MCH9628238.1 hypothetical protein [Chlamydiia bacterium]